MRLTALDVRDFRIVEAAAFEPIDGVNLIVGRNAAGKTSLLEAVHLLATGRSFAATRTVRLIRHQAGPLRVVGQVRAPSGAIHRLGVERRASGPMHLRLDGQPAERLAALARVLPVIAIHPESHDLVGGGPGERRRLLDLGLFHVEPGFHDVWRRYQRALSQRNALLRTGGSPAEFEPWDRELATAGESLDTLRRGYVEALAGAVGTMQARLFPGGEELALVYRRGWPEDATLAAALTADRRRASDPGSTAVGPHRADLSIRLSGQDVRQRVSRGQQKLLVYLLRLAQAAQLRGSALGGSILLLDDLPAELDADKRRRVVALAGEVGAQLFVTALDADSLELPAETACRTFHVEQGRVGEMLQ